MKRRLRLFTIYASLAAFVIYWTLTIAYSMYVSSPYVPLNHKKSRPELLFYQNWSLFTPPDHRYLRLYFILKDSISNISDTTEVIKSLSEEKIAHAPFNQKQDILTQLLYRDLNKLYSAINTKTAEIKKLLPDTSEPYYSQAAAHLLLQDTNGKTYITCIRNYAEMFYKNNGINTRNKQLKIIISTREMTPYQWPADSVFTPKEVPFFQTVFTPIQ